MEGQKEDTKLGVVMIAIDDLTYALGEMQKDINRLEKKLEPVVIEKDKSESEMLNSKDKKSVLVSRAIDIATAKVYELNDQLKMLTNKISI